jgi:hypothetical protein
MSVLIGIVAVYALLIFLGFFTNGFGGKGLVPFSVGVGVGVGQFGVVVGRKVAQFHRQLLFGAPPPAPRPVAPFEK